MGGIEVIIVGAFFVGFLAWAYLSGRFKKRNADDVTREPTTLRTEPGHRPGTAGPRRDEPASPDTRTNAPSSNAQNMP